MTMINRRRQQPVGGDPDRDEVHHQGVLGGQQASSGCHSYLRAVFIKASRQP